MTAWSFSLPICKMDLIIPASQSCHNESVHTDGRPGGADLPWSRRSREKGSSDLASPSDLALTAASSGHCPGPRAILVAFPAPHPHLYMPKWCPSLQLLAR